MVLPEKEHVASRPAAVMVLEEYLNVRARWESKRISIVELLLIIQFSLTAGGVREALVHHGHVLLLCGQNSAPCRQKDVAGRCTFDERLQNKRRYEEKKSHYEENIKER